MTAERLVVLWRGIRGFHRGGQLPPGVPTDPLQFRSCAFECFANDLRCVDRRSKQHFRNARDFRFLNLRCALTRHRGGRAYADEVVASERQPAPSNQECNVSSLATAIRVKLVENQKSKPMSRLDECSVLATCEEELEHHVVC